MGSGYNPFGKPLEMIYAHLLHMLRLTRCRCRWKRVSWVRVSMILCGIIWVSWMCTNSFRVGRRRGLLWHGCLELIRKLAEKKRQRLSSLWLENNENALALAIKGKDL